MVSSKLRSSRHAEPGGLVPNVVKAVLGGLLLLGPFFGCAPTTTWKRSNLYFGEASIELPGALNDSQWPTPPASNPIYIDGHAYHANYASVDVYVMDAKLRQAGRPESKSAAQAILDGFAKKHGYSILRSQAYKSTDEVRGIQLLVAMQKGNERLAVSVHCITRGRRQAIVRIAWPSSDKESLDVAFRISNSLKLQ
jgi:hypothetical protein